MSEQQTIHIKATVADKEVKSFLNLVEKINKNTKELGSVLTDVFGMKGPLNKGSSGLNNVTNSADKTSESFNTLENKTKKTSGSFEELTEKTKET